MFILTRRPLDHCALDKTHIKFHFFSERRDQSFDRLGRLRRRQRRRREELGLTDLSSGIKNATSHIFLVDPLSTFVGKSAFF